MFQHRFTLATLFFLAVAVLYLYVNHTIALTSYLIFVHNIDPIWFVTIIFLILIMIMHRFMSKQCNNSIVIDSMVVLAGLLTVWAFYSNSSWSLFIPSSPLESSFVAGNFLSALLGFVFIFVIGFGISLILSKDLLFSLAGSIGLGAGMISLEMLVLSFFDLLYPTYILILTATIATILILLSHKILLQLKPRVSSLSLKMKSPYSVAFLLIIAVFVAIAFYESLSYPPTEWDSLAYGVTYARIIYLAHRIPLIFGPSIGIQISANYPPGLQLVSVFLYNFAGGAFDIYYRILEPIFAVSLLIVVYRIGHQIFGNRLHAELTVFALAAFPGFWFYAMETSYVMFTSLESAIAVLAIVKWYKTNQKRFLIMSGLACGFAAMTSYGGFISFFLPILLILAKYHHSLRRLVENFAIVCCSGFFSLIWLLRNLVYLHNPLYPLGGIGLGLTPVLYKSTSIEIISNSDRAFQTFHSLLSYILNIQSNIGGPLFLMAMIAILLMGLSIKGTFSTEKDESLLVGMLLLFSIFSFLLLGATNGFFLRYLIFFLPSFAVAFVFVYRECSRLNAKIATTFLLAFLVLSLIMSGITMEGYNAVPSKDAVSQVAYLTQEFGPDAEAWNWINTHTPSGAVIATFEIRTYYINRTVIPLDGNQMAPLYYQNLTAEQVENMMTNLNVSYILSVDWASPTSPIVPQAYYECALTRYLGNPNYFPTVYANSASAVYKVGKLEQSSVNFVSSFSTIFLSTEQSFNSELTNHTDPPASFFYIPVQPDFSGDTLSITEHSSANVSVEIFSGEIPYTKTTNWWNNYESVGRVPLLQTKEGLGALNPTIEISLQNGYYTLVVVDWSRYIGPLDFNLSISVHQNNR